MKLVPIKSKSMKRFSWISWYFKLKYDNHRNRQLIRVFVCERISSKRFLECADDDTQKNLDYNAEKSELARKETRSFLRLLSRHDNVTWNYNRRTKWAGSLRFGRNTAYFLRLLSSFSFARPTTWQRKPID